MCRRTPSFIYAVSKYYYDLNLSLSVKSITLFFTGIIFMIAWYYFTQKERNMKKQSWILIITNLLLLLGYLNWSIYQKEQTLSKMVSYSYCLNWLPSTLVHLCKVIT